MSLQIPAWCRITQIGSLVICLSLLVGCKLKDPEESKGEQADKEATEEAEPRKEASEDDPTTLETGSEQESNAESAAEEQGLGKGTEAQLSLLTRAKSAFLSGRTDEAERLFRELSDTGPMTGPRVSAYIALGQIYNETGRSDKAVELYQGLAEKVDNVPEVQIVVARSLAQQGENEKAIEAYRTLLREQPDYIFALTELAELYAKAGKEKKSAKTLYKYEQKVYDMAEKLDGEKTPAQAKLHVLDVFSMLSDDKAVDAAVGALEDPNPSVRAKAAVVLEHMGAVEAVDILKKVADRDPNRQVRMSAKSAASGLQDGEAGEGKIGPTFVEDKDQLPK